MAHGNRPGAKGVFLVDGDLKKKDSHDPPLLLHAA